MTDELVEKMARAIIKAASGERAIEHAETFQTYIWRDAIRDATAALAALRETHHLIPKDQEPEGWLYGSQRITLRRDHDYIRLTSEETETPLYALEKRHD